MSEAFEYFKILANTYPIMKEQLFSNFTIKSDSKRNEKVNANFMNAVVKLQNDHEAQLSTEEKRAVKCPLKESKSIVVFVTKLGND